MPSVPRWARIVSLLVGVALVVPYFGSALEEGSGVMAAQRTQAAIPRPAAGSPPGSQRRIFEDSARHSSQDGIEVSGLLATGEHRDHVSVGDRIAIRFSLRNTSAETATFEYAFIAARTPGDENRDFGEAEQGTMLGPGDAVEVSSSIVVERAGIWSFWPCYSARARSGASECPDEWRRFEVAVES